MKSTDDILDELGYNPAESEMRKCDGFDDCIIGVVTRIGSEDVFCYDTDMVINKLMTRDGMKREEAEEFFSFNIAGAYVGECTPCFLRKVTQ